MTKILDLDLIGIDSTNSANTKPAENIVIRMDKKDPIPDYFHYLLVSDNVNSLDSKTDLFIFDPFQRKDILKRKAKRGVGIEISIANTKQLNGTMLGRWIKEVKSIYQFCKSNNCQFILSSGANSINEMISARTFESILKFIGISPNNYWEEFSEWLDSKYKARWTYVKS